MGPSFPASIEQAQQYVVQCVNQCSFSLFAQCDQIELNVSTIIITSIWQPPLHHVHGSSGHIRRCAGNRRKKGQVEIAVTSRKIIKRKLINKEFKECIVSGGSEQRSNRGLFYRGSRFIAQYTFDSHKTRHKLCIVLMTYADSQRVNK